jgi:hypothetical protein
MSGDLSKSMPDLSGFSLCFMESPGVDYISLIFERISDDQSMLSRRFIYLFHSFMIEAHFECDPLFPRTKAVIFTQRESTDKMLLKIEFSNGILAIEFGDITVHTVGVPLQTSYNRDTGD